MSKKSSVTLNSEEGAILAQFMGAIQRVMFMTPESFVKMMKTLNATFGTAGFTMCHMMGEEKGRYDILNAINALKEQGIPFNKRQILETLTLYNTVAGWGDFKLQKYDEKHRIIIIRVENNPLAIAWGKTEKPTCHLLRGYWASVVSETIEQETHCTETKCISKGDPNCEFVIGEKETKDRRSS